MEGDLIGTVTPPPVHRPIMVAEVLEHLRPGPGDVVVDCTLGGGGHARALLERIRPGGRLIGLDVDQDELIRTERRLRAEGAGPEEFVAVPRSFADLPEVVRDVDAGRANVVFADLGVSAMQLDTPARGFDYKRPGPLDMRMDPRATRTAAEVIDSLTAPALAALLRAYADEPHADAIAGLVAGRGIETTHALERAVRMGLNALRPDLSRAEVKLSVRRTFQALRIAVNDEFGALDSMLRSLPRCLAPGGRVAILTFHSGEDRPVKQAFREGARSGIYVEVARDVVRSTVEELRANRRAQAAKLRWAVRSAAPATGG